MYLKYKYIIKNVNLVEAFLQSTHDVRCRYVIGKYNPFPLT